VTTRIRLTPRTLRARITVVTTLAVFLVLGVVGAGLVGSTHRALVERLDDILDSQAELFVEDIRAGRSMDESELLDDELVAELRDAGGAVRDRVPADAPPLPDMPSGERAATVEVDGAASRMVADPVDGGTVLVAGGLDDVGESTAALLRSLVVAVPLAAAVLGVLVWWAVGRALRPVERIRERVDSIGAGALDRRVPEPGTPREIDRLARTMNAMLARLQAAAEQQRQFVADASHELRSPLARMRAELEVDEAHPSSADPHATAESVLAETVGLQRLVEDLLLLARGDAGALRAHHDVIDLDEVVTGPVARARSSGAAVDASAVRPVQVRGDRSQLERAVGNLVDNAVRHADNRVTVAVAERPAGTAELVVSDDGPGVAPADRERVFERFTRLDAARSSADGGAGLGLAIARDIAERHGGTLILDPSDGGARFVLTLPAVDPDA
jgi:signal transduction histidine kinase